MRPSWQLNRRLTVLVVLAMATVVEGSWSPQHYPLFTTYFEYFNLRSVSIYACTEKGAWHLGKHLARSTHFTVKMFDAKGEKDLRSTAASNIQGILVDFQCYSDYEWTDRMLNTSYNWLIFVDNWAGISGLEGTKLNLLSDVVVANCSWDGSCDLLDAYRIRETHTLNFLPRGKWKNSSMTLGTRGKRRDLNGTTIVGGVALNEMKAIPPPILPPDLEDRTKYPGLEAWSRYHIQLYHHLERLNNFKIVLVRSLNFGYPLPNGSFDGLIGDVLNGRVDLGVTAVEPRPDRASHVNFLVPMWALRIVFMLRQPTVSGSFSALVLPLSREVWLCVIVFIILFSICIDITGYWHARKTRCGPLEGLVLAVEAFSQQGLSITIDKTSSRILSFFLLMLSLIVMSYYNAAIMNALLLPVPVSIRTLDQLTEPTSPVKAGFLNVTYLADNRSAHRYVPPKTASAVKQTPHPIMDLRSGVKRVKDTNFALCGEDVLLYEEVQRTFNDAQKCDLSFIPLLPPFSLGGPISKTSPFRDVLTKDLMYLLENGLADREKRHWRAPPPQCYGSISFFYVSLQAVGIPFAILGAGMIISMIAFMAELSYSRKRKSSATPKIENWKFVRVEK